MDDKKRLVEVCSECGCAACYHGDFMCWDSKGAGTKKKTVEELDQSNLEHAYHYSKKNIKKVYGDEAPHGYKTEQPIKGDK